MIFAETSFGGGGGEVFCFVLLTGLFPQILLLTKFVPQKLGSKTNLFPILFLWLGPLFVFGFCCSLSGLLQVSATGPAFYLGKTTKTIKRVTKTVKVAFHKAKRGEVKEALLMGEDSML